MRNAKPHFSQSMIYIRTNAKRHDAFPPSPPTHEQYAGMPREARIREEGEEWGQWGGWEEGEEEGGDSDVDLPSDSVVL